ncbi:unnamed protein product, partial [Polarella glacialis]
MDKLRAALASSGPSASPRKHVSQDPATSASSAAALSICLGVRNVTLEILAATQDVREQELVHQVHLEQVEKLRGLRESLDQ